MKLLPIPEKISEQFQCIWSYIYIAGFPGLSVAIKICSSACFHSLNASILKYIWFSNMIVQNGHSLQSKYKMGNWKHVIRDFSLTPLYYQFSMATWPATTRLCLSLTKKSRGTNCQTTRSSLESRQTNILPWRYYSKTSLYMQLFLLPCFPGRRQHLSLW